MNNKQKLFIPWIRDFLVAMSFLVLGFLLMTIGELFRLNILLPVFLICYLVAAFLVVRGIAAISKNNEKALNDHFENLEIKTVECKVVDKNKGVIELTEYKYSRIAINNIIIELPNKNRLSLLATDSSCNALMIYDEVVVNYKDDGNLKCLVSFEIK